MTYGLLIECFHQGEGRNDFLFPPIKCAFLFFIFMPCCSKWDPSHNAPIQMLQYNKNRKTHCKILITCKCPCALVLMCSATGVYHAKHRMMILFGVSACVRFDSYDKQDNTSRDESSVIQSDLFCLNGGLWGIREEPRVKMVEKCNALCHCALVLRQLTQGKRKSGNLVCELGCQTCLSSSCTG